MKHLLLTFFLLLTMGASAQQTPDLNSYRSMFWEQLARTCTTPVKWEKSVQEMEAGATKNTETKVFLVDCAQGVFRETDSGKERALASSEFAELFEYDFDDPYIRDYLTVERKGASVYANLRAENEGDAALSRQVFEVDEASGVLRFAEIKVVKSSLLYNFELHTKVWFDEKGIYQRHETETYTRVVLSGSVRTLIEGKRLS